MAYRDGTTAFPDNGEPAALRGNVCAPVSLFHLFLVAHPVVSVPSPPSPLPFLSASAICWRSKPSFLIRRS